MTDPIRITADYVVAAGENLVFQDVGYAFALAEDTERDHPSLSIYGSVDVASSNDTLVVSGIREAPGTSFFNEMEVWIHKGGSLNVDVQGAHGGASGIRISGGASMIENDGVIAVSSASGAQGVFGGGSFTNTGRMDVDAQWDAGGVYFNGSAGNTGLIAVTAQLSAYGLLFRDVGDFQNEGKLFVTGHGAGTFGVEFLMATTNLVNSGRIVVKDVSGVGQAVGILLDQATLPILENTGLLKADTAILATDAADGVSVNNHGKIIGDIVLGDYGDGIVNAGKIVGNIDLGAGADVFQGPLGLTKGTIFGGAGDDTIAGGRGDEHIVGDQAGKGPNDGNDVLTGGLGADTLDGGGGADMFVYVRLSDSSDEHVDLIRGLTDADLIDLHYIDADKTRGANQSFHLVSTLSGHAGELALSYDPATNLTTISGDVDGDGLADLTIHVAGDHADFTHFLL